MVNTVMVAYDYIPKGVCPSMIHVVIDETTGSVQSIALLGGCHGWASAMLKLLRGRTVEECVDVLGGIKCGRRGTSCPDQVAEALKLYEKGTWNNGLE